MNDASLLALVHPWWYPSPLALLLALALFLPLPPGLRYLPPAGDE